MSSAASQSDGLEESLDFLPLLFRLTPLGIPGQEQLCDQAVSAYARNPIPAILREKLFAYLSRYSADPSCLVLRSCALHALGISGGDVLQLLTWASPVREELLPYLDRAQQGPAFDPAVPDAEQERTVIALSAEAFRDGESAAEARGALRHYFGEQLYPYWVSLLGFVKTCHVWAECLPDTAWQEEPWVKEHVEALLAEAPALAAFFRDYREQVVRETASDQQRHLLTLNEVLGHALEGISRFDAQSRCLSANAAYAAVFGYAPEDLEGRSWELTVYAEDIPVVRLAHEVMLETGRAEVEVRGLCRNGSVIYQHLVLVRPAGPASGEFYCFAKDISERKHAEAALRRARDAAEAGTRAKGEFLANMSHEIRTPLNGVLGMAELLADTPLSSEQQEYLRLIQGSGETLLTVINDILDFSKIEAGKLDLERVPFALREVLQFTLGALSVRAGQKGLKLIYQVDPAVPEALLGDPNRLCQVLLNLIGNAIKFTSEGEVVVSVAMQNLNPEDTVLHFTVRDTGIGIAADKQAAIFQSFTQEDASMTRRFGGTGLGLTIASHLVRLMGGAVCVESAPGKGSTFQFTARFPVGRAVVRSAGKPASAVRPLDVLLVEDEQTNRLVVLRLLERDGHRVAVAHNGREAVAAVEARPYDVILMDIQMPELSGLEATRRIRALEERAGGHTPIVALTAHAMKGDRERCLDAGMDDYLTKPLQPAELRACLARVHGSRSAESALDLSAPPETAPPACQIPSAPASEAEPVLNLHEVLDRVEGDQELLETICAAMRDELPGYVRAIDAAVGEGDAGTLVTAAHRLKGAAANFSAGSVVHLAQSLESIGQSGNLADARQSWNVLRSEVLRLDRALAELLARHAA